MKPNLKNYPKNGSHWEKNVWKERFEKELREINKEKWEPVAVDVGKRILIKEILGE